MDTNPTDTREVNPRTLQRLQKKGLSLLLDNRLWGYESSWDKANILEFRGKWEKPGMMVLMNFYIKLENRFIFWFSVFKPTHFFIYSSQFEGFLFVCFFACFFWHCLYKISYLIQFSNSCLKYWWETQKRDIQKSKQAGNCHKCQSPSH